MSEAIRFTIPVFCIATMFAMGLDVTLDDIVAPFRNKLALVIIVLVNNILVPLLGFVILAMPSMLMGTLFAGLTKQIVSLTNGQQIGFLLLLLAPGSLLAPVVVTLAGAKQPFAKGTMVLLVGASIILVPFELALLCQFPALGGYTINSIEVFSVLSLYQLLPLALGILINGRYSRIAEQLRPLIVQLASLTFLAIVALVVISGQMVSAMPGTVPIVRTGEFPSKVLTSTPMWDAKTISDAFKDELGKHYALFPRNPLIKELSEGNKWMIVDADTTYIVRCTLGTGSSSQLSFFKALSHVQPKVISDNSTVVSSFVKELNDRRISSALIDGFEEKSAQADFDLVVVITKGQKWALVNSADTYFIEYSGSEFTVYRETSQPLEVVAEFLKSFAMLKPIGPAIDFLKSLISTLIPYAMFLALAVVLMTIGYYSGMAVRNVVGTTNADIPQTLAISTTVRNVSVALILANTLPGATDNVALNAITVILVFYTVSLIVAAIQADKWSRQPDTAPVAPASQSQAAVIAPERTATSTP